MLDPEKKAIKDDKARKAAEIEVYRPGISFDERKLRGQKSESGSTRVEIARGMILPLKEKPTTGIKQDFPDTFAVSISLALNIPM